MFYFDISVKDLCFEQIENILSMAFTLDVSQLEISGIDNNDSQSLNKYLIWIALLVFHFETSGRDSIELQQWNIPLKSHIWVTFTLDKSGTDINDGH